MSTRSEEEQRTKMIRTPRAMGLNCLPTAAPMHLLTKCGTGPLTREKPLGSGLFGAARYLFRGSLMKKLLLGVRGVSLLLVCLLIGPSLLRSQSKRPQSAEMQKYAAQALQALNSNQPA